MWASAGPTKRSRDRLDAAVGSSITNLRCVEGENLTLSNPSVVAADVPAVNPSSPGEPYLAPRYIFDSSLIWLGI